MRGRKDRPREQTRLRAMSRYGHGLPAVAAWIAHAVFWVLFWVGWGELGRKRSAIALFLWVAGFAGLRRVPYGGLLFPPYVALLDVALVLVIFKGDVKFP